MEFTFFDCSIFFILNIFFNYFKWLRILLSVFLSKMLNFLKCLSSLNKLHEHSPIGRTMFLEPWAAKTWPVHQKEECTDTNKYTLQTHVINPRHKSICGVDWDFPWKANFVFKKSTKKMCLLLITNTHTVCHVTLLCVFSVFNVQRPKVANPIVPPNICEYKAIWIRPS